jgi:uncharacterized protein (DUF697 family)
MSSLAALTNFWDTIKEADLRPLREQALRGIRIAVAGAPGSGRSTLVEQMRRDPSRPQMVTETPVLILDLQSVEAANQADLIILVVDSRKVDTGREQELVRSWNNSAKKVLVFINHFEQPGETTSITPWSGKNRRGVVWGSAQDSRFLVEKFAPAVIDLVPEFLLALGRFFPLFRVPTAHYLISDTCFSNAAYSFSTGLAEIVPVLGIPVMITDTVILTKNQLFLVYKLGLMVGFSTNWQDYIAEFSGVLGTGFVWRQIARSLVGLVPVWGIVPKTAIAYAGTYVVGNAVLGWYLTGRHISKSQMQALYSQALERGKALARNLLDKRPRLSLPRPHLPRLSRPRRKTPALLEPQVTRVCSSCGKTSSSDAQFCQYCGKTLERLDAAETQVVPPVVD